MPNLRGVRVQVDTGEVTDSICDWVLRIVVKYYILCLADLVRLMTSIPRPDLVLSAVFGLCFRCEILNGSESEPQADQNWSRTFLRGVGYYKLYLSLFARWKSQVK